MNKESYFPFLPSIPILLAVSQWERSEDYCTVIKVTTFACSSWAKHHLIYLTIKIRCQPLYLLRIFKKYILWEFYIMQPDPTHIPVPLLALFLLAIYLQNKTKFKSIPPKKPTKPKTSKVTNISVWKLECVTVSHTAHPLVPTSLL